MISGYKNSLASLEHIRDEITSRHDELLARGINVTVWGADIRDNKVKIGVKDLTPGAKIFLVHAFGPSHVEVVEDTGVVPTSKYNDSEPWYGGDGIANIREPSYICTSGFTMLRYGSIYVSTAGHCGYHTWYNYGQEIGSTYLMEFRNNGDGDEQLIGPTSAAGYVFAGTDDDTDDYHAVTSYSGYQYVGDTGICADGYFSSDYEGGDVCGGTISATNQCKYFGDKTTCALIVVNTPNQRAVRRGDSGGPVYNYDGYSLNARGIITGYDGSNVHKWYYSPIRIVNRVFNAVPVTVS